MSNERTEGLRLLTAAELDAVSGGTAPEPCQVLEKVLGIANFPAAGAAGINNALEHVPCLVPVPC